VDDHYGWQGDEEQIILRRDKCQIRRLTNPTGEVILSSLALYRNDRRFMKERTVRFKFALIPVLLSIAVSAWAQMPAKPGPEVQKLAIFVGTWTTEGTIAQGPWGMGGKFTATDTSDWLDGNFFIVGHSEAKMPPEIGGDSKGTSYIGYSTDENVYTMDSFNSQGRRETMKGTVSGDTWTWTGSQVYGGQDIKQRMTIKILSPSSHSMKFEVSVDGTNWMPFMEAKVTKK